MSGNYSTRIADMLPEERPRERMLHRGPASLSGSELLAILIRTGTAGMSAVQVAEALLREFGGLAGLATASLDQMAAVKGMGPVKAIEVTAALELGKRLSALREEVLPEVHSPEDVAQLLMGELRFEKREHLCLLIVDSRQRVRRISTISVGTLSETLVHPREVFAEALRYSAAKLILVHNHPSGDPAPSPDDITMTRRLCEAGKVMGIDILDHVILGAGRWASLKQLGLMG